MAQYTFLAPSHHQFEFGGERVNGGESIDLDPSDAAPFVERGQLRLTEEVGDPAGGEDQGLKADAASEQLVESDQQAAAEGASPAGGQPLPESAPQSSGATWPQTPSQSE